MGDQLQQHNLTLTCHALSCALQLSTVLGAAIPEERAERKWIEGIAIWAAIFLVTLVSEWHLPCLGIASAAPTYPP